MRTEDGYIIHKCLNGDSAAFGFLVDKYRASVYSFAYERLHNFHDAEDVAQEVFLRAYQKLRTLRRWDSFASWLYRIALNLCRNWIRAQSSRPDREFIEDQDTELLETRSGDLYLHELAFETVREALDTLPEMYNQVLTLHHLGGMTSMEIARFTGVSPSTIRMRLMKARALLKEEMLEMMDTTLKKQRLQSSFTFRVMEVVKRISIEPMPRTTGLPWGLSLATGIVFTFLSFIPQPNMLSGVFTGSPLHSETKVLKTGEIPVDILAVSEVPVIADRQGKLDNAVPESPESRKAKLMAVNTEDQEKTAEISPDAENIVVEPATGLRFAQVFSDPKLDVIGRIYYMTVSGDGNYLYAPLGPGDMPPGWVIPLKQGQEPFKITPFCYLSWS